MAKSNDAMNECKAWIRAACKSPMVEGALDQVLEPLRDKFQMRLDGADGPKTWADDTPKMRDNGRYMGVFAEFFAQGEPAVTVKHLEAALCLVSAKCTVGKPPSGSLSGYWVYCDGGGMQSMSKRHPAALSLLESASGKTE